jgi:dGTPase
MTGKDYDKLREQRVHSEEISDDNRTSFQRDRDRILYTPAFRRLGGVAQVVHVNTERGYHNRLTHSLKVAQVGRRLAENILQEECDNKIQDVGGLNPNVVETACLAHDIGHPPFGHPAEEAIQNSLNDTDKSTIGSFEGNPQSFRIVNSVAIHNHPYGEEYKGLDLTLASLNAILKYPWSRDVTGKKSNKWGYYSTEESEFQKTQNLRTPGDSNDRLSVEAKIMDWADDLTYAIHDLADFYRAGLIPFDELIRGGDEQEEFIKQFECECEPPKSWDATGFLKDDLPNLTEMTVSPLKSTFDGSSADEAAMGFVTSELVERYLGIRKGVDVKLDPSKRGGLTISEELKAEINLLQYLCDYYVFSESALLSQQHGHRQLIEELFKLLYDATEEESEYRGMLPSPFDEKIEAIYEDSSGYEDIGTATLRARVVGDIIASMTEQQAMELYERVTGRSPGIVTDQII